MLLKISDYVSEPVIFTAIVAAFATLWTTFRKKNRLPKQPLLDAAQNRDLEKFKAALARKKVDVNEVSIEGFSPLIKATLLFGQKYLIEELIEKGAFLDWQDRYGNTALHYAVQRNKKTLVKVFVEQGTNLSLRNEEGKTPDDIATEMGKTDLLEILKK